MADVDKYVGLFEIMFESKRRSKSHQVPQALPGAVDVSDLTAGRVNAVAADTDVYLKRRGGRTYLVPAN
jgi:hypothetical protein